MKLLWVLCSMVLLLSATIKALDYSLTLRDGPGSYAGRVEVNNNGTWGSLCDTDLTIDVGHVICRQLGYPRAIATPCCNAFGPGNSPFWLYDVKCKGNESSLAECDFKTGAPNICDQRYDFASVVCENRSITDSYPLDVRLSYGPFHYAGCVEVKYAGIWGDVGMFRWDKTDGRVVCRQLGYQDVLTVLWRCSIWLARKSDVVTWIDTVQCSGNESSLTNCTHEWQTYRSSFGFDAGVVCQNKSQTDLQIRLRGSLVSYAGRVEVLLAGKWGAIDRFTWQLEDAHVACKQLGFSSAELALRGATFILNNSWSVKAMNVQWVENVRCLGNESLLIECPLDLVFTPGPVLEAGVVCASDKTVKEIRLAGSNVSNAGRVEVNIAGIWGTIRNKGWDMNASNVACRQLGYPGAESATVGPYGKGVGPVWMSDLDCEGREDSLWKCSWPRIAGIYWDHDNDAGVICKIANSSSSTNAPTTGEKANSSLSTALKIGLPVTGAVILLLLVMAFYFRCYRKERRENNSRTEFVTMSDVSLSTESGQTNPGYQRPDSSYHVKLDSEGNSEIDWCEISRERLSLGEKIETKTVGATFQGKLCLENGNMAKCIVKTTKEFYTEGSGSLDDVNDLLNELKILSCLGSHPNILNLFGACTVKGPTYLIFEEAEHGNLLDYLQEHQSNDDINIPQKVCTLSNVEKLRIALDVSKGMKHIAERKCMHKDVAARNIRLGNKSVAKVTNIGCSRVTYEDISAGKLPVIKWMAPETLESMNFSSESDIWSFGILLWEIETGGDVPYSEIQAKDLLQSVKSGHRMEKPVKSSSVIYEVMTKCWQSSPNDRPKFSELCMVLETMVTRETSC